MHCQSCGAELPADARFCIECGADVGVAASTGATMQLPRASGSAVACPACGAANPDFAVFCVRCGHRLSAPAPAPALGVPRSLARTAQAPSQVYRRRRHRHGRRWEGATGALFLIGLGALFLLKLPFWPGILILAGLVAFVGESLRGRYFSGLSSILWLFGLAFLFSVPRLWWPGILVLIGLSVLLDMARRALRRP